MSAYGIRRGPKLARRLGLTDDLGISIFGVLVALVAGLLALFAVLTVVIVASSRAVGRTTCHNFAAQTGFQTKFSVLNPFDTGTCLAKAPNGKWVLNTRIVQFIQETKP